MTTRGGGRQPATAVLIYGGRTSGVKRANDGWTRFERVPSAAQPQVHERNRLTVK